VVTSGAAPVLRASGSSLAGPSLQGGSVQAATSSQAVSRNGRPSMLIPRTQTAGILRHMLSRHMIPTMTQIQIQIQTQASRAPGTSSSVGFVSLVDATTMSVTRSFVRFVCRA